MPLAQEEARRLALAWASTQPHLTEGWHMSAGAFVQSALWDFKIRYLHPTYGVSLLLIHFYVHEDGSVAVRNDKREKVALMLSSPEGFERERRFFKALESRVIKTPRWFLKVSRATSYVDARGIDGFAHVSVHDTRVKLPFQIKSSKSGRNHFFRKHPECVDVVIVVIADDESSEHKLRMRLYNSLGEIRHKILSGAISLQEMSKRIDACINRTAQ